MSDENNLTILHLSDIQFGKNHRFGMELSAPEEPLDTLLEADKGEYAEVIVSSRTQHFESDRQVRTALGAKVETAARHRIAGLQAFDEPQIRLVGT